MSSRMASYDAGRQVEQVRHDVGDDDGRPRVVEQTLRRSDHPVADPVDEGALQLDDVDGPHPLVGEQLAQGVAEAEAADQDPPAVAGQPGSVSLASRSSVETCTVSMAKTPSTISS